MSDFIVPYININPLTGTGSINDIGKIKSTIAFDKFLAAGKLKKNEDFVRLIEESEHKFIPHPKYFTESVKENFDIYGNKFQTEMNGNKYVVQFYFYILKNPELLTKQLIVKHSLIFKYDFFTKNNILNMDWHQFNFNKNVEKLNELTFYNLSYQQTAVCNTRLFPHQISNISKMLQIYRSEDPTENIIPATDNLISDFGNGLIYDFVTPCFVEEEDIPKIKIRGGMILDEPGTGKTLQFLVFLLECDKNALVLTPNSEIKKVWVDEFQKHISVPLEGTKIRIISIEELLYSLRIRPDFLNDFEIIGIDEIHKYYTFPVSQPVSVVFNQILTSNIRSRWGITGTPFVNHQSFFNIIRFLSGCMFTNERFANIPEIQKTVFKLFMRNIKANMTGDYKWPELNIHDIMVELDVVQRNFYDIERNTSNNKQSLRRLASEIQLLFDNNNIHTPSELKAFGVAHYKKIYEAEQEKLAEYEVQMASILENQSQFENEEEFQKRREHYEKLIADQSAIAKKHNSAYEYFSGTIGAINDIFERKRKAAEEGKEAEEPEEAEEAAEDDDDGHCPICFDSYTPPIKYLKKCGHYYCDGCISHLIGVNGVKCPMCRQDSRKTDIITVNEVAEINYSPKMHEILRLIAQFGDQERFIIFSQFNLLDKLKIFLGKNAISATAYDSYVRGEKDTKVLLMASHMNAEGVDLTVFDNIIIFEPFEDHMYAREIEKQLIGRIHRIGREKPVKVFRLITKDTIEEEIYRMF